MNWRNVAFDWNQTRAFLITAEEGTLSAAARALGMTQPTLGRQVAALEEALGVTLFERVGRSLVLRIYFVDGLNRNDGPTAGAFRLFSSRRIGDFELLRTVRTLNNHELRFPTDVPSMRVS